MVCALTAISIPTTAFSQKELAEQDTLMSRKNTPKITILETREGIIVHATDSIGNLSDSIRISYPSVAVITTKQKDMLISGEGDNYSVDRTVKTGKSRWNAIMGGVCLGLSNPIGQDHGGGLEWSKSIEAGWFQCLGVSFEMSRHTWLSLGIGFNWRNYKITTSDKRIIVNSNRQLEWDAYPAGAIPQNSRLKIFSLQFPLMFTGQMPGTSLIFEAGPIFNFNTYGSVLTQYKDNLGNKYKDFTKDIDKRLFTVDIFGSIYIKSGVGIYARYSPMKVMNGDTGINFTPLSIGIIIGGLTL